MIGGDEPDGGGFAPTGVAEWVEGGSGGPLVWARHYGSGGPFASTTPDLQHSHPATRGQSRPRHIRERGGFLIIFKKGQKDFRVFEKRGVWVFVVENSVLHFFFARMLRTCASVRGEKKGMQVALLPPHPLNPPTTKHQAASLRRKVTI